MKITYLIPGSGDNFYCGNCQRDTLYVSWLKKVEGIDVSAIPLYLPPGQENFGEELENKVFFGAVSLFLREKVPLLNAMPTFVDRILDSSIMLNFAAKQAGTTNPEGLETTTLNMIRSKNPARKKEVKRLAEYIIKSGGTDIIHISNALIIGLAAQLKQEINKPVICSLQNEDDWINEMQEPYASQAWKLIAEEEKHIDKFIATSNYFKQYFISKTGIDENKIHVVPPALEVVGQTIEKSLTSAPAIGFYSRLNKMNGLDKLVDAFIALKQKSALFDLKLHLSGGFTSDEKRFIHLQISKLKKEGFEKDVILYHSFTGKQKESFFNSIDLLCVPVRKHDAFGLYLLEAISHGVPVVQPHTGSFPEIIRSTKGGFTYSHDIHEYLVEALDEALSDREKLKKTGETGKETIKNFNSPEKMAFGLIEVYNSVFESNN
ncbi:MAG: glycosyltransferase family 4 protein [Bacteroidota bacterium]